MSGGVKLRRVTMWIVLMLAVASLALAHVWKLHAHARFSREIVAVGRERDKLASEILLLDTETRALRQYSRLEAVARDRLGLVDPGPPVMIHPAGQILADAEAGGDGISSARWRGFFR